MAKNKLHLMLDGERREESYMNVSAFEAVQMLARKLVEEGVTPAGHAVRVVK